MPRFKCAHKDVDKYSDDSYDGGYFKVENCLDCGIELKYEYVPPKWEEDNWEDYL